MDRLCYWCGREFDDRDRKQIEYATPTCRACWLSNTERPIPTEFEDEPTQPMTIPAKWFTGYDD